MRDTCIILLHETYKITWLWQLIDRAIKASRTSSTNKISQRLPSVFFRLIMADFHSLLLHNIKIMNDLAGFNVVIVCCSSSKQAQFWQARLEKGRGSVLPSDCVVLSVEEDWVGGAGNGKTTADFYLACLLELLTPIVLFRILQR